MKLALAPGRERYLLYRTFFTVPPLPHLLYRTSFIVPPLPYIVYRTSFTLPRLSYLVYRTSKDFGEASLKETEKQVLIFVCFSISNQTFPLLNRPRFDVQLHSASYL